MKLSQIENSIKKALVAPNGVEPTAVTIDDANDQQITLSFTIPSIRGVKTIRRLYNQERFYNFFHERLADISFGDVLNAYLDSQTQLNDVAHLREQATGTDMQQQAEATKVGRNVLAEESDHRGIIEQNTNTAKVAHNSR